MKKIKLKPLRFSSPVIALHGKSFFIIALSLVPVTVGTLIYLLFRTERTIVFGWLSLIGFDLPFHLARNYTLQLIPFLPDWLIYSFPHSLWTVSYSFLISYLWVGNNSPLRFFWFATIPLLGFSYEIMQYWEVIPGTFCKLDLLFCFLGIISGLLITMLIRRGVLLK